MSEPAIYKGDLGRIVRQPLHFDAWDWQGEYLGTFVTVALALTAMRNAQAIHQSLVNAYNHRHR